MEQFSIEKYLKNPNRKIITRDGRNVRIICVDRNYKDLPIVALIQTKDGEVVSSHTKDGSYLDYMQCPRDLFFMPEKKTGWINIYDGVRNANASRLIYNSKEEALACANKGRVDTIKIEWEK